jgi:hypothetical protein
MPGIDELYPPMTYAWYWWLVLPAFIALLVAWLLLSKRAARVRGWSHQPPDPEALAAWRPRIDPRLQALSSIQNVENALRGGQMTVRDAHLELSSILRDFAYQHTGVDARTMTLEELRSSNLGRVAQLIEDFYPVAFAPDPSRQVDDALANARSVVRTWS